MDYKDLNIIYEDNHIIVVVKPQNVPSQGDSTGDVNMVDLLKMYLKETYKKEGNVYLGLVHRLDRPTGGVMVFAKTSKAAARLSESIRNEEMEKSYLCITTKTPAKKMDTIVSYLKKNPINNLVYVATATTDGAKKAILSYKVLKEKAGFALIKVDLQTGRSHQIRVQMSSVGAPIFGDAKYGDEQYAKGHFLNLWAYSLKLIHPTKNEKMSFFVLPPNEFEAWKHFELKDSDLY